MIYRKAVCIIILTLVASVSSKQLNIPSVDQEMPKWCWAACCQMTLCYYGIFKTQTEICEAVFSLPFDQEIALYNTNNNRGVNYVLNNFGEEEIGQTYHDLNSISKEHIFQEIDKESPIILLMDKLNTSNDIGHMILIKGYNNNNYNNPEIIINNPDQHCWYYPGEQTIELTYLQKHTSYWEWDETLRLEKSGIGGSGIFDGVSISGDDITYNHPADARTFTGRFVRATGSYAHATNWQWRLSFYNAFGEYVAGSFDGNEWPSLETTWNAPGFSFPSNYYWNYDCNGAIRGSLTLKCIDTDGYHHFDTKIVKYIPPSSTYPMIHYFAYGEISTSFPEVKAHHSITLRNFQISSGADVTFRAGEKITIKDNVTIQNGSTANFIVDSSVR